MIIDKEGNSIEIFRRDNYVDIIASDSPFTSICIRLDKDKVRDLVDLLLDEIFRN